MKEDPDDIPVYSPEASDTSRWGDWQTKVGIAIVACIFGFILLLAMI